MPHSTSTDASVCDSISIKCMFSVSGKLSPFLTHENTILMTSATAAEPAIASPDGRHLATLSPSSHELEIRDVASSCIVHRFDAPHSQPKARHVALAWGPISHGAATSTRILLATQDTVRVWDLEDPEWSAVIDNGSNGMGSIAHVEFGTDDMEVLVFSNLGALVTIWSLWDGRSTELRDPKFTSKGHGRSRPGRHGVFALLSRPATQDILSLHVPGSYEVLRSITLPTVDAQGLRWSPDGRWIAIWDASSLGYKVLIYTADGHLYRTYSGDYFEDGMAGLGVKSIEWSPNGDILAIGGYEKSITMLSTRTFSPAFYLAHVQTLRPNVAPVYQETLSSTTGLHEKYIPAMSAVSPPMTPNPQSAGPMGTALLSFNADGSYLATKHDSMPTTAWIWDLTKLRLHTVIVQHAPIRRLKWHLSNPDLLLLQTQGSTNAAQKTNDSSIAQHSGVALYLYNSRLGRPRAIHLSPINSAAMLRADSTWLNNAPGESPAIYLTDASSCTLIWPNGRSDYSNGTNTNGASQMDMSDVEDSLYEILSGRSARRTDFASCHGETKFDQNGIPAMEQTSHPHPPSVEDTFCNRGKGVGVY